MRTTRPEHGGEVRVDPDWPHSSRGVESFMGQAAAAHTVRRWGGSVGSGVDEAMLHARAMVDAVAAPLALLDDAGFIVAVNRAWEQFAEQGGGDRAATGVGVNYLSVCERSAAQGDADGRAVADGLREVLWRRRPRFTYDYPCAGPDGEPRWFELTATPVSDPAGVVVLHTDVTARVAGERANFQRARQDQLTGLANRLRIQEVLQEETARCSSASPLTVAFVDVDLFKNVNDSLGHAVGDLLLIEMSSRLQGVLPTGALLGRLGGDEFIVVAPGCGTGQASGLGDSIRRAVADPFEVAGTHLPMSVSVGLATSEHPEHPPSDLLRDADAALYAAKDSGRDRHHQFTPSLHQRAYDRLAMLTGLRRALGHGELRLHYQPVVDLRDGRIGGYEALMRWEDPTRGMQSPGAFIPLAEESGLIVPMSRWLLAEAAGQAARWVERGFGGKVAVNISAVHLSAGTLVDDVLEALEVAGLPSSHLIVEITETALASDTSATTVQLQTLREHGVEVAIDDFGAGYSSLGQLAQLPADVLKLDRSLLPAGDGSAQSNRREAVARAVATAGQALGMLVLAEGVETPDELAMSKRLGCTLAQGYLLGRPQAATEVLIGSAEGVHGTVDR